MEKPMSLKTKKSQFDRYIGRYVVIFPQHASSFVGRIKEIDGAYIILNPFIGSDYEDSVERKKLIEDDSIIRIGDITAIEPTTRKSLDGYCELSNLNSQREALKNKTNKPKS